MDCTPLDTWWRLVLNFLAGGLMGYWGWMVRRERRELRELAQLKATMQTHIETLQCYIREAEALTRDDDDPAPPMH